MDQSSSSYIAVRDANLDALVDSVNVLLAEGYRLAGPLLHVAKSGSAQAVFVQSLLLERPKAHNGDMELGAKARESDNKMRVRESGARSEFRDEACAPARWSITRPALRR